MMAGKGRKRCAYRNRNNPRNRNNNLGYRIASISPRQGLAPASEMPRVHGCPAATTLREIQAFVQVR